MPTHHRKVPATPANFKKDHQAKLKIDREFEGFHSLVRQEAEKSRDVSKLLRPLASLRKTIIFGAYGIHLVPVPLPKKKKKVLKARAGRAK